MRATPAAAIRASGQPVVGRPPWLAELEDGPGVGAWLGGGVAVDVVVGDTDGDGEVGDGVGEVGDGVGEVGDGVGEVGDGVGEVGDGVGAGHATQNTFCLARPCSPVKFQ
jgi:X-X-X-Leu-X-X-Gly heptad repeat protein